MKKSYLFAIIPFVLGICCFVTFKMIGSYVAEDGTLVEPFGLIPIGFLMFAISFVVIIILGMKYLLKKR
jgi:hypothetical protein